MLLAASHAPAPAQRLPAAFPALLASLRALHASAACTLQQESHAPSSWRAADAQQLPGTQPAQQYATHVPLHPLQKGAVALLSALGALARPARGDLVGLVGETWGDGAVRRMRDRMAASATGRQILAERPRVTDAAVARCWSLPGSTFGGAYADFMGSRGFHADDRPVTRLVDDEELAYVITRAREVHDFWHVLTGCHTNVFGELALKAVELVQTGLPMAGLAVAGAQFKLSAADRALLWRDYMPWAMRTGLRSADLMCIYYEKHFEEDLQELRARWRITPAPLPPEHLRPKPKRRQAAAGLPGGPHASSGEPAAAAQATGSS